MPEIKTVQEHIAWSYANLARADKALRDGVKKYAVVHHMVRARLYKGLCDHTMSMATLYKDERLKMTVPQACYYCGSTAKLSVDHLIPRIKGGADESDNLIWACRSCNSSKRDKDMLKWMFDKELFPSILLLRRYLKIIMRYCEVNQLLELDLEDALPMDLPFDLRLLPHSYPALEELVLWVYPASEKESE
jgi:hypothetical protein